MSLEKRKGEPTLYIKAIDGKILIVILYVDNLVFTGDDDFLIIDFKEAIKIELEMSYLESLELFSRHRLKISA